MSENNLSIESTGYEAPPAGPVDSWMHSEAPPFINYFLEILSRRKGTILTCVAAAFALMAAVTLMTPWTYRGEATVEVTPLTPNVTTFAAVMSNSSTSDEYTRTQAAILKNPGLASRVIKKLDMDDNRAFNPFLAEKSGGVVHRIKELAAAGISRLIYGKLPPSMARLEQREALVGAFEGALEVQSIPGTNVITVSFSSTDRHLAKQATNETVNELMNWQVDRYVDATRFAKARLEKQVGAAHSRLEKSQAQLDSYARRWGIVSLKSGSNLISQQLETINQAIEKVKADRIAKLAYYHSVEKGDLGALPAVMQNNLIQWLENDYTQLMSKYEQLRLVYKQKYQEMPKLEAQIAYTGRRIGQEQRRILSGLKADYTSSREIERTLEAAAEKNRALALDFNNRSETYKTLQGQVDINRKVYMSLLKRAEEIDANVGTELGNVKVLSRSSLPVVPYKPNLLLNFLIGLVLGIAGGVGMAFILENSDTTLKSPGEVSQCNSTRILGALPLVDGAGLRGLSARVLTEPDAIFSEAIRFTRTFIDLSSPTGKPARSILITSTEANAGKSTVAANLALSYASSGQDRVLLVDGDLSPGGARSLFTEDREKSAAGLSEYLRGHCPLDKILCKTELQNLFFIPSGGESDSSGRVCHPDAMKNLMRELASRFDRIIVDGQPFGSDTMALGKVVDGVIVIAAIGKTHRKSLQIFLESMSSVGANVLGVIVNKLQANRCSFDHYSRRYGS